MPNYNEIIYIYLEHIYRKVDSDCAVRKRIALQYRYEKLNSPFIPIRIYFAVSGKVIFGQDLPKINDRSKVIINGHTNGQDDFFYDSPANGRALHYLILVEKLIECTEMNARIRIALYACDSYRLAEKIFMALVEKKRRPDITASLRMLSITDTGRVVRCLHPTRINTHSDDLVEYNRFFGKSNDHDLLSRLSIWNSLQFYIHTILDAKAPGSKIRLSYNKNITYPYGEPNRVWNPQKLHARGKANYPIREQYEIMVNRIKKELDNIFNMAEEKSPEITISQEYYVIKKFLLAEDYCLDLDAIRAFILLKLNAGLCIPLLSNIFSNPSLEEMARNMAAQERHLYLAIYEQRTQDALHDKIDDHYFKFPLIRRKLTFFECAEIVPISPSHFAPPSNASLMLEEPGKPPSPKCS